MFSLRKPGEENGEKPDVSVIERQTKQLLDRYIRLDDGLFAKLFKLARFEDYREKQLFPFLGTRLPSIAFVLSGVLKSTWIDPNGLERVVELLEPGDFVANNVAYLSPETPAYEISALTACTVLVFEYSEFDRLCQEAGAFRELESIFMQRILARRTEHMRIISMRLPMDRYMYIMNHRPMLLQRVSLTELAKYLYLARETVSRCRARMKSSEHTTTV